MTNRLLIVTILVLTLQACTWPLIPTNVPVIRDDRSDVLISGVFHFWRVDLKTGNLLQQIFKPAIPLEALSPVRFEDGIDLEFPMDTTLAPGEHLLLARNATDLSTQYPNIRIMQYDGSLSDQGERLELVDALRNPADVVHYYDSGRWHGDADGG